VKLLARIVGGLTLSRGCQLLPHSRLLEITLRPRPPVGLLIAVSLPGCPALDDAAITAWLAHAYHEHDVRVLRPQSFRPAVLGDFLDALNADRYLAEALTFSASEVAAFARDRGGALLAEIRGELEHGLEPGAVLDRVHRFARIVAGETAAPVLAELAALHALEHLLGLEHAVAQWIAATASPRAVELGVLARTLPDDPASAGVSRAWFEWWWRLARTCTRVDLMTIVDRTVELADEHCAEGRREPLAVDARAEAREMASRMRSARRAELWSPPPSPGGWPSHATPDDAHHAAFMAVSHAAHALAHALRGHMSAAAANRAAMQTIAELAVRFLLDDPGDPDEPHGRG
jgi:hypothetical protein